MENFAVTSDSFALYEAFKKDVENIGWKYCSQFNEFKEHNSRDIDCLYFSNRFIPSYGDICSGVALFSFAGSHNWRGAKFSLETQYGEALAFAKKVWEQENNPKFKKGDWARTKAGEIIHIDETGSDKDFIFYREFGSCWYGESQLEKWSLRDGEYYAAQKSGSSIWIGIKRGNDIYFDGQDIPDYCHICIEDIETLNYSNSSLVFVKSVRPATPSEIALLDSKLAEKGKRFDKDKLKLVDIEKPKEKHCGNCSNYPNCGQEHNCFSYEMWEPKPQHKEPIIGELAIGWNCDGKERAMVGILRRSDSSKLPYFIGGYWFRHAILFESPEQFKAFLKS